MHIKEIIDISYKILIEKISHKQINCNNEASFQHELAYIIRSIGQLFLFNDNDTFVLEFEKNYELSEPSIKSKSKLAVIDLYIQYGNIDYLSKCAIELKYYKKSNLREPNNRYDFFKDLHNLEQYKENGIDLCYLILATDHLHYYNQNSYTDQTKDFDFRQGRKYLAGTVLEYKTEKPYGVPIKLKNSYDFNWDIKDNIFFLKIEL